MKDNMETILLWRVTDKKYTRINHTFTINIKYTETYMLKIIAREEKLKALYTYKYG